MRITELTYIGFLLLLTSLVFGQSESTEKESDQNAYQIISINIEGNEKTDEKFLLTQLSLMEKVNYRIAEIEDHIKHLTSLDGLYDVDYRYEKVGDSKDEIDIHITVKEQRTLLPVINFGQADSYRWFQLGFTEVNLFGKGNELFGFYQYNGGRHAGQLFYKDSQIGKSKFGYSANLLKWQSVEPLFFNDTRVSYNYDNNLAGISAYYLPNRFIEYELGTSLFNEVYTLRGSSEEGSVFPAKVNLVKGLIKVGFDLKKLKFHHFLIDGHAFNGSYQYVHTFENGDEFNIVQAEYKFYKMFFDNEAQTQSNFAFRMTAGISTNNNSPFSPFVIDSYKNIRGVGDRVERGTAIFTFNTEYRKELWFNPKWSVQGVSFVDLGTIGSPSSSMKNTIHIDEIEKFAGVGARVIYKKIFNGIFRVDYAIDLDDFSNRSLVFGLGQYF